LRILYFSRDYTTHDHRFLTALSKTDHQVYYLRLERRGHQLEDRPLPPNIETVPWVGGQATTSWQQGLKLFIDLKRVLDEIKPDLVQAGPLQRSALLVALAGFQPLVSMSWGYDLIHDAHRNTLWSWATRFSLQRSAVMIGDCDTIRQLAISFGMPDERIITFPWGIDLQHFTPEGKAYVQPENTSPNDTFTLLSTRGWEPIYGTDLIARAFASAAGHHPGLRLVMLGNGSQAAVLRQIFTRSGVQDRVFFPGQISQADLPRYYRMADLYISASHSDGTSISLLEAMACGKPVLVSDIPGNREWVNPPENGWYFPDGDVNALTQGILHALVNRESLPEMGSNARQVTEVRANWQKNFAEMLRAYDRVLEST
jgi:glycosyltransferase involved in cell wall biosynthesis